MKRRAILIEASRIKKHPDLPGARADIANYRDWLLSNAGGAWEETEIVSLSNPSLERLRLERVRASDANYAFVVFTGHGGHVGNTTRVQLNDTDSIDAQSLAAPCLKCTVVIDSCRSVEKELLVEDMKKAFVRSSIAFDENSRPKHRALFDSQVQISEAGDIFLYACSIGEAANDYPNGGWFSFSLLKLARVWALSTPKAPIYTVWDAFRSTQLVHDDLRKGQTPSIEGSVRRNHFFPLGVHA